MKISYKPSGVCCRMMNFEIDSDNKLRDVEFIGGCDGNLKGISKLVEGMDAKKVSDLLIGNTCGNKCTSCPDQLAKAIAENI
ncbi:TIGR03905 family TSCPD domain-containing protein [Peptacetobacter hominis]|uniref:TIGR03905 family TSCPD domain-containing protein n=1 Tax=Peptacetobacter hominis TaxID=2743610 RepID=UPI0015830895|nr:TIGR03905 family TSCPD domain-containing protein [Peptacetobacter hominis]